MFISPRQVGQNGIEKILFKYCQAPKSAFAILFCPLRNMFDNITFKNRLVAVDLAVGRYLGVLFMYKKTAAVQPYERSFDIPQKMFSFCFNSLSVHFQEF